MNAKNIIGKILIICLALIIILIVCMFIVANKQTNNKEFDRSNSDNIVDEKIEQNNKELEQVKSATAYFTVQSCVNKYISYILENDSEAVYNILDNDYIEKNEITENNVLNKINDITEQVVFEATKMYVEEIDENNNKYYVSGVLKQDDLGYIEETTVVNDNFSIAVVLNLEDMIFSIIPLEDGGIFNEENS